MFDDDLDPITKQKMRRDLAPLSVSELEAYIVEMKEEIERVQADITQKKAHADLASSVFGNTTH